MPEIGLSGSMSGEWKRDLRAPAPFLDSTVQSQLLPGQGELGHSRRFILLVHIHHRRHAPLLWRAIRNPPGLDPIGWLYRIPRQPRELLPERTALIPNPDREPVGPLDHQQRLRTHDDAVLGSVRTQHFAPMQHLVAAQRKLSTLDVVGPLAQPVQPRHRQPPIVGLQRSLFLLPPLFDLANVRSPSQ
jgi:hypothetical protein